MIARRAHVSGRVQGVYFRQSTAILAEQLGLRGHARNLVDGRVEVLAIGDAAAVARLVEWLWQGPPAAKVTAVVVEELDLEGLEAPTGFARL